jgi:hypothetical protein
MFRRVVTTLVSVAVVTVGVAIAPSPASGRGLGSATHLLVEYHAPNIPGPPPATVHGTAVARQWTSRNWSGYAITGGKKAKLKYTSVGGTWTVPTVTGSDNDSAQYSATWVGIDGFLPHDQHLIQAGTEEDWIDGSPFYQAWWEILPAPETPITTITVHPGDTMDVSITRDGSDWTIAVTDTSTGRSFTTDQTYQGPLSSAEWIQEAPTLGRRIATLADDSTFAFALGTANGANPDLVSTEAGTMVNKAGVAISTPSVPDTDTDGFAVAYGAVAPPAPST